MRITESAELIEGTGALKQLYTDSAGHFSEEDILRLISIANEAYHSIKQGAQPQIDLELALIKMIKMDQSVELSKLIEMLESSPAEGAVRGRPAAGPPVVKKSSAHAGNRPAAGSRSGSEKS